VPGLLVGHWDLMDKGFGCKPLAVEIVRMERNLGLDIDRMVPGLCSQPVAVGSHIGLATGSGQVVVADHVGTHR